MLVYPSGEIVGTVGGGAMEANVVRDAQAALARPYGAQGQSDAARRHGTKAHAIARGIEKSLVSSGLDARLRMTGEWQ